MKETHTYAAKKGKIIITQPTLHIQCKEKKTVSSRVSTLNVLKDPYCPVHIATPTLIPRKVPEPTDWLQAIRREWSVTWQDNLALDHHPYLSQRENENAETTDPSNSLMQDVIILYKGLLQKNSARTQFTCEHFSTYAQIIALLPLTCNNHVGAFQSIPRPYYPTVINFL